MDLYGGAAVWGDAPSLSSSTSTPKLCASTANKSLFAPPKDDPFDEFDDFGDPSQPAPTQPTEDDDFGDFEDFAQEPVAANTDGQGAFNDDGFGFSDTAGFGDVSPAVSVPLRLNPMPDVNDLTEQVGDLLIGVVTGHHIDDGLTGEGIRQIEGPTQLLVTQESRSLYKTLFEEPAPLLRAPNWTRSKIRRNHLITLGIPVNLDEVNPQSNGRALPTLNIITRPSSAPPRPGSRQGARSRPASRLGTPIQTAASARFASAAQTTIENLGPKPEIDQGKIDNLLRLDPDNLPLLPIPKLEAHKVAIQTQTVAASNLLSYLLQCRDALQQDSDAFNKKIANLVNEAQKMRSGVKRQPGKRSSGMS